jgi:hypothetical protein
MFLGLPDPDPFVSGMDPDLVPDPVVTLFDFLSLKNDVNVHSKSKKYKFFLTKISLLLAS